MDILMRYLPFGKLKLPFKPGSSLKFNVIDIESGIAPRSPQPVSVKRYPDLA